MADSKPFRVLLVEDHEDSRIFMSRLLGQHYEVTAAGSFTAALDAAAEHRPDVVVTDISLGEDGDGIALMRELRRRFPVYGIAVSGSQPKDPAALREAGIVKWFLKPIQFTDLLAAVAEARAAGAWDAQNASSSQSGPPAESSQLPTPDDSVSGFAL